MALVVNLEKAGGLAQKNLASLDNWEYRAVMVPHCALGTV